MKRSKRPTDDELLIEYLENDLEAPFKEDIEVMLTHSAQDRQTLKSFETTKNLVNALTQFPVEESDDFHAKLHSKIMAGLDEKIEENEVDKVVWLANRRWVPMVAAAVLVIVVGTALWTFRQQTGLVPGSAKGDLLVSTSASDLETFADTLLNTQNDNEFFMDVAVQKIETLSHDETASVFNRLME